MESMDRQILWSLILLLLPGVLGDGDFHVKYPRPICAIEGSTVIIPCSYSYPRRLSPGRVIWCINHEICQGPTPKIYDSESETNKPGLTYLGDLRNNCTLQIKNIKVSDTNTYRFRFETNEEYQHTERSGVKITVEKEKLNVSSSDDRTITEGDNVTLTCTSALIKICTFNQLEFIWYRDNHTLPASGPTLHLNSVSQTDSGNYSCAFKSNRETRSDPYRLHVEVSSTGSEKLIHLIVVAVLLALLAIIVAVSIIFIRRRKAEDTNKENRDVARTAEDVIYTGKSIPPPTGERSQVIKDQTEEEHNYAEIDSTHMVPSRPVDQQEQEEPVIYSLASRPVDQQEQEEPVIYSLASRCQ